MKAHIRKIWIPTMRYYKLCILTMGARVSLNVVKEKTFFCFTHLFWSASKHVSCQWLFTCLSTIFESEVPVLLKISQISPMVGKKKKYFVL